MGDGMGPRLAVGLGFGVPPPLVPNKNAFFCHFTTFCHLGTLDTRGSRSVGPTGSHRRFKATPGRLKREAPARMRSAQGGAPQRALRPRRAFRPRASAHFAFSGRFTASGCSLRPPRFPAWNHFPAAPLRLALSLHCALQDGGVRGECGAPRAIRRHPPLRTDRRGRDRRGAEGGGLPVGPGAIGAAEGRGESGDGGRRERRGGGG